MAHTKRQACMEFCRDISCLHIPADREKSIERKYKGITMAQWHHHLQNSSFVNRTQYTIVKCNFWKPYAQGLTAGW